MTIKFYGRIGAIFLMGIIGLICLLQKKTSAKIVYSTGVGLSELILEATNASQGEKEDLKIKALKAENSLKNKQSENGKRLEMKRPIREVVVQFDFGDDTKLITDEQFKVMAGHADMALKSALDNEFDLSEWEGIKVFDQVLVTVELTNVQKELYETLVTRGNFYNFFDDDKPAFEPFRNLLEEVAAENNADSYIAVVFGNSFSTSSNGERINYEGLSFFGDLPNYSNERRKVASGLINFSSDLAYNNEFNLSAIDPNEFIILSHLALHEGAIGHSVGATEHTCTPSVMFSGIEFENCTAYTSLLDYIAKTGEYFDNENKRNIDAIIQSLKDKGYITEAISSALVNFVQKENIYIYPTVIRNYFSIDNRGDGNIRSLSLFNLSGLKVRDLMIEENSYDLSSLASGCYLLNLTVEKENKIKVGSIKIVKY